MGKFTLSATIFAVPLLLLLQTIFLAGIAMTVSSASVLFRDLRDIVTNLLQLGFFMTPILYLVDNIQSRLLRALLRVNPMTPFVVAYQDIFFFGRLPNLYDSVLMVFYAAASLFMGLRFWPMTSSRYCEGLRAIRVAASSSSSIRPCLAAFWATSLAQGFVDVLTSSSWMVETSSSGSSFFAVADGGTVPVTSLAQAR